MMNVTNLPAGQDAPLTLEQRVAALEAWAARVTRPAVTEKIVRSADARKSPFGAPPLADLIEAEGLRVAGEDDL